MKPLASGQGKLYMKSYPTKPWLHTRGHPISQTNTRNQSWWPLLSLPLLNSSLPFYPTLTLCKLCAYIVGQKLTHPFQCQVCNLRIKPGDFFVDPPTSVVPFNHVHLWILGAPFPLCVGHYNFPSVSTMKRIKELPYQETQRCNDRINLMKLKSKLLKTSRRRV